MTVHNGIRAGFGCFTRKDLQRYLDSEHVNNKAFTFTFALVTLGIITSASASVVALLSHMWLEFIVYSLIVGLLIWFKVDVHKDIERSLQIESTPCPKCNDVGFSPTFYGVDLCECQYSYAEVESA